ncbi:HEPN domain-containing protein [Aliarcobacter lanthieri]|uniref:ApeA N-terminal domain 1-containing protein n=1 Tax=Aliarcobacter lanthieri TaxID=1355374 RepID=UPI003AAEE63D
MNNINSLTIFGTETNNLSFHGELIFENDGVCCINYIGNNLVEKSINEELIVYGKLIDKTKFTAICIPKNEKKSLEQHKSNNILIKRLFLGEFIQDLEKLEISNIYIRTSYLESWFYDFPFDNNTFTINKNEFLIDEKIKYSDKYTLSFEHEFDTNFENNRKFIFNSSYYLKIETENKLLLSDFENESKKILNLFKFLMPSKDIFIEDRFFFIGNTKVKILEKQFFYKNELLKNGINLDYIVRYDEKTSKDLIINWFNLYDKYEILIGYLFTIFDDNIIKTTEIKFLFYMQWIEGFCREKFPTKEDEKEDFNQLVQKLKNPFNKDCDEYKWIEEQTKYGLKQNFLKQIKLLIQELKVNKYIDIIKGNRDNISYKIKKYRDELTHLEPNRKNYKNMELVKINHFIKGIIAFSIFNELKVPKESVKTLLFIQIFRDYDDSINYLFTKSTSR